MKTIYLIHIHDYENNDSTALYSDRLDNLRYLPELNWLNLSDNEKDTLFDYLDNEDISILSKINYYDIRIERHII